MVYCSLVEYDNVNMLVISSQIDMEAFSDDKSKPLLVSQNLMMEIPRVDQKDLKMIETIGEGT